jgi:hypothetical protein
VNGKEVAEGHSERVDSCHVTPDPSRLTPHDLRTRLPSSNGTRVEHFDLNGDLIARFGE